MGKQLSLISLLVNDYDEAIRFYIEKLNFQLVEDTVLSDSKRWVVISPSADSGCRLLLAKAANQEQHSKVGNQTGGRVFLFLQTDNFERDFNRLLANGVKIVRQPSKEIYGMVAVFADLYGNLWDLIEPTPSPS